MSKGAAAGVDDPFQLAGSSLEGRFRVDHPVAEGGFGVVYRGAQDALDRPVAIKVLKTPPVFGQEAREQFLSAFAAEAKTIARITHPNIVQVYDFGVSLMPSGERAAWMALEWLTGQTLDDALTLRRGRGGQSPRECLGLLRPILSALATVHAAGVAHRDLKPANIMLVPAAGGPTPKLLDFGIAKVMGDDEAPGTGHTATRSHQIAFSPGYASPEQISQGRSGPWTDVHAIALLLTEMLTDKPPLSGENSTALFQQILDNRRPTPAKFGVDVGPWEAVLARAVAVTPGDRYRNAGDLLAALEETADAASRVRAAARASSEAGERLQLTVHAGSLSASAATAHTQLGATVVDRVTGAPGNGPQRRSVVAALALLGVLAAFGIVAGLASFGGKTQQAPGPPSTATGGTAAMSATPEGASGIAPARDAASGPIEPTPVVPATATTPETPRPTPAAPAAHPKATAHTPAPGAPGASATVVARPSVNCDPPFTVDAAGRKHYKPECDN